MVTNYVTGSHGFIGQHLLKFLQGKATIIPHKEISSTKIKPFDNFFFLSTYGNMIFHQDDEKIFQANVLDLIHVLQQAVRHNFKSFVFVSTSSVTLSYQTTYSRAKRAAEEILLAFKEKYGLPICIIRPYSITGVGEQPSHLIPTLIRSCYEGGIVNFVPEPIHDFIDVEDVVKGIINLSENKAGGVFELGSGIKYPNQGVLRLVEKATGRKANVNKVSHLRAYDNLDWVSHNFKARGYGWQPTKKLKDSIKEMVEVYKNDAIRKKSN